MEDPGAILGSVGALGRGLFFLGSRGPQTIAGPQAYQLPGMPNGMRRLWEDQMYILTALHYELKKS